MIILQSFVVASLSLAILAMLPGLILLVLFLASVFGIYHIFKKIIR
ncbi:hypothetical protein [Larkinella punicea]|nr:hypothetical protein [Larkinella punicea]